VWKMGGWSECLSNWSSFPSHKLWSSRLRSFGRCLWCSEVLKTNCAHLFSSDILTRSENHLSNIYLPRTQPPKNDLSGTTWNLQFKA
jgi:hypothetical protein